jgi:hypothetical protein
VLLVVSSMAETPWQPGCLVNKTRGFPYPPGEEVGFGRLLRFFNYDQQICGRIVQLSRKTPGKMRTFAEKSQ